LGCGSASAKINISIEKISGAALGIMKNAAKSDELSTRRFIRFTIGEEQADLTMLMTSAVHM